MPLARRGVDRAVDGHRALLDRVTTWVAAEAETDRRQAIAIRGGMLLGGAWVAYQLGTPAIAIGTPAWIGAAWWHGATTDETEPTANTEPPQPLDPAAARLRDLTAIRGAIGDRRGIHLAEITDRVQAAGIDWDMADVRAWITGHGVPIRPKVRVGGKAGKVSVGVHVDDLDAALNPAPRSDPDPSPAGVAAGHEPLHPPLQVELQPAGERRYTLDDEPVWPGTTPT